MTETYNLLEYKQTGEVHVQRQEECQDMTYTEKKDYFIFAGVADGQSGKSHSSLGAKLTLRQAAEYLRGINLNALKDMSSGQLEDIKDNLFGRIRNGLRLYAQTEGVSEKELASTLCCIAIDPNTGSFAAVHLGDGLLSAVDENGQLVTLSGPENGFFSNSTWLTASADARQHLRMVLGSIPPYQAVYATTDGLKNLLEEEKGKTLLEKKDAEGFLRLMKKNDFMDDAALAALISG